MAENATTPLPCPPALLHRLIPGSGNVGVLPGGDGVVAGLHGLAAHHAGIRPAGGLAAYRAVMPAWTAACFSGTFWSCDVSVISSTTSSAYDDQESGARCVPAGSVSHRC
jgi:hypothetical protein